jgi:hypothetical protein
MLLEPAKTGRLLVPEAPVRRKRPLPGDDEPYSAAASPPPLLLPLLLPEPPPLPLPLPLPESLPPLHEVSLPAVHMLVEPEQAVMNVDAMPPVASAPSQ